MKNILLVCCCAAVIVLSVVLAVPANATNGAQPLLLTTVPQAAGSISVDGKLDDWVGVRPAVFVPLDLSLSTGLTPAMQKVAAVPHDAAVRACYDSRALYLAVEWQGLVYQSGKTSYVLQIHLLTDRMVHFQIDSVAPGAAKRIATWGDEPLASTNAVSTGARSVVAFESSGKGMVEEIALPWKLVTATGRPPSGGHVRMMVDFSWGDLTPSVINQAPLTVLHSQKFITASLLTSQDRLFDTSGYLPNPSTWGDLVFVAHATPNDTLYSPMTNGTTLTNVAPASAPLQIDGDLSKWNPSVFQTASYAPGFLGGRYSGKIAMMYDANFVYIALRSHTGAGIRNVEPENTRQGFWGGDCLQMRLSDGRHTVNVCGWCDTSTNMRALTADGQDLTQPFLLKAGGKEAFKVDADGQGYSQEIAIPYQALGYTAATPATKWKATFQVWWAGLEPQFTGYADATLQPRGALAFHYTAPAEGDVTLGIYDSDGHLLRWIARGVHRHVGANVEYWDGLDQWGAPLTAGSYAVKGIEYAPAGLDYKLSLGNSGNPPWPTANDQGDWLGDESTPQAAATDGDWVYLASPDCEKGWGIIGVDGAGQRRWGFQPSADPRCVSLAVSGNYVYGLYSGPVTTTTSRLYATGTGRDRAILICLDKHTGQLASFSTANPAMEIATWPYREEVSHLWDLRANKSFSAGNYGGQPRYFLNDIGESTNALGLAATATRIYYSNYYSDSISVLDAATAKPLDSIPVPKPVGLHALPDGRILVVSEKRVLVLDPQSKGATVLIDHDLAAPHDITTDKAGNIYVSDWGASFQVKEFSPSGALIRAIGTPGGRPWAGQWDAGGMLAPRGIAVTDTGRLWVAEDDNCPSRVSVWDAASGVFVRDYLGPSSYGGGNWFWVNPKDPSMVMTEGTLFHVDYAAKSWTPVSTALRRMSMEQPFMPNGAAGIPATRTIVHGGRTYMSVSDDSSVTILRLDGDVFTPVAAVGYLDPWATTDGTGVDDWDSDLGHHHYVNWRPAFFSGHQGQIYTWSDKNGDGLAQPDEMMWTPTVKSGDPLPAGQFGQWASGWGSGVGPDGSIYIRTTNSRHSKVFRLDISSWTNGGAPSYDLAASHEIIDSDNMPNVNGMYVTNTNRLIVSYAEEWPPQPKNAIECYDRDGKYLWGIARYQGAQQIDDPAATNVSGDFTIPGIGDVIGTWEWHLNQHSYLLTDDGLYLSVLCDDNVVGPTQNWGESMRSYFQTPAGAPYLVNGANDAYHLLRITGLGPAKRFEGKLVLTSADVDVATAARTLAASSPAPTPRPVVRINWAVAPPAMDGSLADWKMEGGVTLTADGNRSARIALKRDATNLYMAYEVHGSAMVNKGSDWRTLFTTGDCVDLMLSANHPVSGTHFKPEVGDERLLLSLFHGAPIAVLYRPVMAGATNPQVLATAHFDQIVKLTTVNVIFKRTADGYVVEASVPLTDLAVDPAHPAPLRGDVGVVYADATGANRSLRLYYYNQDTRIVDDLTTEATLQPGDWGEIDMAVGANALRNGGFEDPFAADMDSGWVITTALNGASATIDETAPHSGEHSLHLSAPAVTYAPSSYSLTDYGAFLKSANNGKGGGYVEVAQRVAVTGGIDYWFHLHYRASGLKWEKQKAGPDGGYSALQVIINWIGAKNPHESWKGGQSVWVDSTSWQTIENEQYKETPIRAPDGAQKAIVLLRLRSFAAGYAPEAEVDDVELVPLAS